MSGFQHFWQQGDAITRSVAALLLLMSVSAWVVIFWKGWLLRRVHVDLQRAVSAFGRRRRSPTAATSSSRSTASVSSDRSSTPRSPRRRPARSKRMARSSRN